MIGAAIALAFASSCGDSATVRFAEADAGAIDLAPASTDASAPPSDAGAPRAQPSPFRVTCTEKPCAVGLSADSVGGAAFCALLDDGRVVCWGSNVEGVLGRPVHDGGPLDAIGLPDFVEGVSGAVALASTCALLADGTVQCWGPGAETLPFTGVTRLSKGYTNRCAVVGPLEWSCIEGTYAPGPDGGAPALYPQRSFQAPAGSPLREVFVGNVVSTGWLASDATLLLREDGTLLSSGSRNFIGRETSLFPVDPHFDAVALANVTDIDVGDCVCAIAGGEAYCWGSRNTAVYPEDALPRHVGFPEPLVRVSAVGFIPSEGAFRRLCAIGASGAVYCSGPNSAGQAGDGTRATAFVPVRVKDLNEPAVDVVAARTSTCALVESGKIYCWGSGVAGALGNGYATDELTPMLVNLP
ncbi:MAG: hypothetical protein KF894_21685 [Labilithrix sp.]|nr:hypothetical protein [Labilithrix sp.]